jgi:hypothetical protein
MVEEVDQGLDAFDGCSGLKASIKVAMLKEELEPVLAAGVWLLANWPKEEAFNLVTRECAIPVNRLDDSLVTGGLGRLQKACLHAVGRPMRAFFA